MAVYAYCNWREDGLPHPLKALPYLGSGDRSAESVCLDELRQSRMQTITGSCHIFMVNVRHFSTNLQKKKKNQVEADESR